MSTSIPLSAIEAFRSPFENDVWRCGIVSKAMVEQAVHEGQAYDFIQWNAVINACPNQAPSQQQHAARIAYLVKHGWNDCIDIDVGVPSLGMVVHWPYTDGNHRICAAIVRSDTHIEADICGDIDYAGQIFGVDVILEPEEEQVQ